MWLSEILENRNFEIIIVHNVSRTYSSLFRVNKDEIRDDLLKTIINNNDVWITPSQLND